MKYKFQNTTLKNGLNTVIVPIPSSNVVSTFVLFGVGSRYEEDNLAGIAHVLEHMHFKGTTKRPQAKDISEYIESIGGEHNAYTSKEYTGYYAKVAAKHLEKSFDFLSDLVLNPLFDVNELAKEKHVIYQELDMLRDMPSAIVSNKFDEAVFDRNALGREIIGTRESIGAIGRDDLIDFRKKYYVASNAVVAVVGNITNIEETLSLLEKYFVFESGKRAVVDSSDMTRQRRSIITNKKTEQSQIIIGFRGASSMDDDKYALKILALILGGSMSSRMFEEIREKRNLAYSIHTASSSYLDTGIIETQAGVAHDKVAEAIEAIMAEYSKIKSLGVTDFELQKAKDIITGAMLIGFEDTGELAEYFTRQALLNSSILAPDESLVKSNAVTCSDVLRVANKYLRDETLTMSLVGPWKKSETKFDKLLKI
ncbi:MAG: pitrilysin family protein [bacterium]